jgi:hypothetical protein
MKREGGLSMGGYIEGECLNCHEVLSGGYCHQCGQRNIGNRLTLNVFVKDFANALSELDGKLWQTIIGLTKSPGKVALNYIQGTRVSYINPVRYFFVMFAVYLAVAVLTGAHDSFVESAVQIDGTPETAQDKKILTFMEGLRETLRGKLNLISFISLPLIAFFLRYQYFRAKRNYPEVLSFVCFYMGHAYFLSIFLVLAQYVYGSYDQIYRNVLFYILYVFSAHVFFEMRWWMTIVSSVFSVFIYMFVSGLVASVFTVLSILNII